MERTFSYEFMREMMNLQRGSVSQYLRDAAAGMRLRPGEFSTLLQILRGARNENEPRLTVSILSQMNHCTKSNMSQVVKELEEKNYVLRVPDEKDRRVIHLVPTEEAMTRMNSASVFGKTLLDETAKRMGEEKARQMLALLQEFAAEHEALQQAQAEEADSRF
jgi:DNA-binding MarR family transcriptional regulator